MGKFKLLLIVFCLWVNWISAQPGTPLESPYESYRRARVNDTLVQNEPVILLIERKCDLKKLDYSKTKEVKGIIFYLTNIRSIPKEIFESFDLEYISFIGNEKLHIESAIASMSGVNNLKEVEIIQKMKTIPTEISGLSQINKLGLSTGKVSAVNKGLLSLNNLITLDLYDNRINDTSEITKLGKMQSLRNLSLRDNEIEIFPIGLLNSNSLQYLDISVNNISTLSSKSKMNNGAIETIRFFKNPLTDIQPAFFQKFDNLKTILFSDSEEVRAFVNVNMKHFPGIDFQVR